MRSASIDDQLQRLRDLAERVTANLVALEVDPSRQLIEASSLSGETGARWSAASAALADLWRRNSLLTRVLERAEELRAARRRDSLRSLLDDPFVELPGEDMPLAERRLTGSAQTGGGRTVEELVTGMSSTFDQVKRVVLDIGDAWDALIPTLEAARGLLAETIARAESLGETGRRDLERAARDVNALGARVSSDPLSVTTDEADRLLDTLREAAGDVARTGELKQQLEARMSESRELLEQLSTATQEVKAAHRELLLKIADANDQARPDPPLDDLQAELAAIAQLSAQGAWRDARHALEKWTARTNALLADARRSVDTSRAPIEARNRYRALLEAYQAKAQRLGLLEDPDVESAFMRAHEELYRAPTDLTRAGSLVRAYQEAVSGFGPTPEVTS